MTTIKLRGDTAANWQSVNPVLAAREIGLDLTNKNFRVGDGITAWAGLLNWIAAGSNGISIDTAEFQVDEYYATGDWRDTVCQLTKMFDVYSDCILFYQLGLLPNSSSINARMRINRNDTQFSPGGQAGTWTGHYTFTGFATYQNLIGENTFKVQGIFGSVQHKSLGVTNASLFNTPQRIGLISWPTS